MTDMIRILIGPFVWLSAFSAVYGLHGMGCALGWTEVEFAGLTLHRAALLAGWGATVAACAVVLVGLWSERLGSSSAFVRRVSIWLGLVGVVAAVWSLFPVAVLSACI